MGLCIAPWLSEATTGLPVAVAGGGGGGGIVAAAVVALAGGGGGGVAAAAVVALAGGGGACSAFLLTSTTTLSLEPVSPIADIDGTASPTTTREAATTIAHHGTMAAGTIFR